LEKKSRQGAEHSKGELDGAESEGSRAGGMAACRLWSMLL